MVGRVAERLTDLVQSRAQTVLEIDHNIAAPYSFLQVFPCEHLTGLLEESDQELERLILQFDADAKLAQLAGAKISLERPKANLLFRNLMLAPASCASL